MATTAEIRQWLVEHGEQVNTKGALPARLVAKYNDAHGLGGPRPLPRPDELDDEPPEQFGPTIDVGDDSPQDQAPGGPGPAPVLPGPGPDEPPKHAGRDWQQGGRRKQRGGKSAPKITVGLRGDIAAKISLMLEVPGQVWAVRDPVCGGTFVNQRPDIAAALTDIVCESADLVAFFTGPAGGFMRWLNLAVACYPVASVVMAHHVYHSIEAGEVEQPNYEQYAA